MSALELRAPRRATPLLFLLVLVAAFVAAGCGGDEEPLRDSSDGSKGSTPTTSTGSEDDDATSTTADGGGEGSGRFCGDGTQEAAVAKRNDALNSAPDEQLDASKKYTVQVKTTEGDFAITLDPKAGPVAAANFAYLVENCFYDGVVFHRIIKDFMVQTGDPTGTGTGGPGYSIEDDEVDGTYERGTVAMANAGPDTGGSQFFVVHGAGVQLPGDFAIFGSVDAKGMKTIDAIADTPVEASESGEPSAPKQAVRITSARLVTG